MSNYNNFVVYVNGALYNKANNLYINVVYRKLDILYNSVVQMDKDELMNVEIGKYALESLTIGMYSEPKIVYREYIQNSVDSLEEAVADGLIEEQGMRIDIIVDVENSKISIRDNGMGVEVKKAPAHY